MFKFSLFEKEEWKWSFGGKMRIVMTFTVPVIF